MSNSSRCPDWWRKFRALPNWLQIGTLILAGVVALIIIVTSATGYKFNGTTLRIETNLHPKGENKAVAKEIALFTVAAIQCGRGLRMQASSR